MFVYNKQKGQNVESTKLNRVEIDASKNESKIRSEVRNRNRDNIERNL